MSVGRTTARAAVWAFFSTAGAKIIALIGLALLARLLSPREFGLLAFAMVYITYAETVADLGTGSALVYWRDRREDAAQVTFLINAVAGIFWFLLTLLIAPYIAAFFNSPDGTPIVRVLSFSFLIKFFGTTHEALAVKDLRFRARTIPELSLASVKAVIAIILAWLGFGAWSLVWGHLAGLTCWTVGLWIVVRWRPSFRVPRDLIKPMLSYGRGIIAVNVLAAITHHADLAVVGRFLGATALGLYQMAAKIPETTVVVVLWVFSKVLFPAFARIAATGEELGRPYLVATRYVSAITLPAAIGLAMLARPLVLVVFGPAWLPAAPILSVLAIYAAMRSFSTHAGDILKASGRSHLLAGLSVIKAVLIVPALIFGATRDGQMVAIALTIVAAFTTTMTLVVTARLLKVPLAGIARSFMPSTVSAMAMAAVLLAWLQITSRFAALAQVLGGIAAGALVYVIVLRMIDPELFAWARESLRRKTPSTEEPVLTEVAR